VILTPPLPATRYSSGPMEMMSAEERSGDTGGPGSTGAAGAAAVVPAGVGVGGGTGRRKRGRLTSSL
jgi:hypothetical protein